MLESGDNSNSAIIQELLQAANVDTTSKLAEHVTDSTDRGTIGIVLAIVVLSIIFDMFIIVCGRWLIVSLLMDLASIACGILLAILLVVSFFYLSTSILSPMRFEFIMVVVAMLQTCIAAAFFVSLVMYSTG